jgi:hypothetical protein
LPRRETRALLEFTRSWRKYARWPFLEEKATQRLWFLSTPIREMLYGCNSSRIEDCGAESNPGAEG